jgi:U3 small nucleolar RNA-associated protein 12
VTCLAASNDLLAIGYSSGTILVYSLNVQSDSLEQLHSFSFHRSSVTSIIFYSNDTSMASGSEDTYIVVYDLVADTA